ncbi:alpha/beta fold hydrolase [Eupransor demetentiae]|uniref:Alpha/beta hydrolase fold (MenH) n=1 Tax=Eupransor demetentiae TaxID=3109584 RepID=A0ABP0ETK9_9LACO|nr:2-succinyl-6-hydroxy-2 [Lactobacillaceae bacterium LMG 33000]
MITYHYTEIEKQKIFYREAGNPKKPTLVLLHGFPSSSFYFRNLMPLLENDFHLLAPDYPGFGQSAKPNHKEFKYSFEHLTDIVEALIEQLLIKRYYLYVFDYGAPIGFRLALRQPESVLGIISQNGNIYQEGLGAKWQERAKYWHNPTQAQRQAFQSAFAPDTIKNQYLNGERPGSVAPDGYSLDIFYSQNANYAEVQSDLIFDYQNNVALYPTFQKYLRQEEPKLLALWGKNDPSFVYPGAEAFKRDLPKAEIHLLDAGHFALESQYQIIADYIKNWH